MVFMIKPYWVKTMTQTQTWVVDFLHMNTVHAIFCTEIFVYISAYMCDHLDPTFGHTMTSAIGFKDIFVRTNERNS